MNMRRFCAVIPSEGGISDVQKTDFPENPVGVGAECDHAGADGVYLTAVQLRRQNLYPFREPVRGGRDDRDRAIPGGVYPAEGSIPENTPVAVDAGGIVVLSDNRLRARGRRRQAGRHLPGADPGGGRLSLPWAGILFCWVQTGLGMALSRCRRCWRPGRRGSAALRPSGRLPRGKEEEPPAQAADPFPDLDYRFGAKSPAAPANVKTVVITQTRPASSAIRNQKGEVRIYASGQEWVPLSVGRRVVSLGGYQITVDIARTGSRTEDITRELPAMRRRAGGQAAEPDTREITIIRPQQKPSDSAPETLGKPDENKDDN